MKFLLKIDNILLLTIYKSVNYNFINTRAKLLNSIRSPINPVISFHFNKFTLIPIYHYYNIILISALSKINNSGSISHFLYFCPKGKTQSSTYSLFLKENFN